MNGRLTWYRLMDMVLWEYFVPNPDAPGMVREQKGCLYECAGVEDSDVAVWVLQAAARALAPVH